MIKYRAAWVFTGQGEPIRDGVIEVVDRQIIALRKYSFQEQIDCDLGESLVTPGFYNAHTHLDLGALHGKIPAADSLVSWIPEVLRYRRKYELEEWDTSIQHGLAASLRAGTVRLADISVGGRSANLLAGSPIASEVYLELIGLAEDRLPALLEQAEHWLNTDSQSPERCLSPHAPYTVSARLLQRLSESFPRTKIAMHVAESQEELELLATKSGPFRAFLMSVEAWHPEQLVPSIDDLLALLQQFKEIQLIHGNYLQREQWQKLPRKTTVVYCPRTHAYFGHSPHPYLQMLADGVSVALGTDSLASNPDLSLLQECRFLWNRDRSELTGETLMKLACHEQDRLAAGSPANFVVIPQKTGEPDPWEALWASSLSPTHVCTCSHLSDFT